MFTTDQIIEAIADVMGLPDVPDVEYNSEYGWTDGSMTELDDGGFIIEINPCLPMHRKLLILSHESVHYEQAIRGDLKCLFGPVRLWRGEIYVQPKCEVISEYKRIPWEAEAYAREKPIAKAALALLKERMN